MILEEYILNLPKIGEGSFGEVFLTSKKNSSEMFATKKIEKKKILSDKMRQYFFNEIEILKKLNHSNIMKLIDIKSTHNNIYLITEYCNGGTLSENLNLYQKLFNTPFTEKIVIYLMKQISDAIFYLHERRIIHRDLKMDNILLHFDNLEDRKKLNLLKAKIKIIDFGFARFINKNCNLNSIVGSPLNMAPDILQAFVDINFRKNLHYNEKADIYSIGVIMFIMLIGKPPFSAKDYFELYSQVNYGIYSIPKNLKISNECISLMNGMMMHDSFKRFSITEVVQSDFLKKAYEKFEIIDFSQYESNKNIDKANNNFGFQLNEKNIFLDIKNMINLENKKQQSNQNEKNTDVLINDINKQDEELEDLLNKLSNKENTNNDIVNHNSLEKLNLKEDTALRKNSDMIIPNNLLKDKKNIYKQYDFDNKENIQQDTIKKNNQNELLVKTKKNFDFNNIDINHDVKINKNLKTENNLIDWENDKRNNLVVNNKIIDETSNRDLVNTNELPIIRNKEIFDIQIEKLDSIFNTINQRLEIFEMEAIPIYLENPRNFENFIL